MLNFIKLVIFSIFALFLVSSCSLGPSLDELRIEKWRELAAGRSLYYGDFGEIRTPYDVSIWIRDNIRYVNELGDVWSDPEETVKRGYGDCEDIAILAMNILYTELGLKYGFALFWIDSRAMINGGPSNHAEIAFNDTPYYSLYLPQVFPYEITFLLTFDEFFN